MEDGQIPKHLLYGELAEGTRPSRKPTSDTRMSVTWWLWILSLIPGRPLPSTELSGDMLSHRASQDLKAHFRHNMRL